MNERQLMRFAEDLALAGIEAKVGLTERFWTGPAWSLALERGDGVGFTFFWHVKDGSYDGYESSPHEVPPTALEKALALGIGIP